MLAFLAENIATILTALALGFLVAVAIRSLVRDKRAGRSSCGVNCSACSSCPANCGMKAQKDAVSDSN